MHTCAPPESTKTVTSGVICMRAYLQFDEIMKSEVPQEFERSFTAPRPRDTEGKTSIIKTFPREETKESPSGMNVLEKIGM